MYRKDENVLVQSDCPTHQTPYVYTNQLFRISVKSHINIIITPTALYVQQDFSYMYFTVCNNHLYIV